MSIKIFDNPRLELNLHDVDPLWEINQDISREKILLDFSTSTGYYQLMSKKSNSQVFTHQELRGLPIGAKFEVVGLTEVFNNLELVSVSEGACQVKGQTCFDEVEVKGEKKLWKNLSAGHTMSPRTEVNRIF